METEDIGQDEDAKKTQDILEQLGLHPSQLSAQDHLLGLGKTLMGLPRSKDQSLPEGLDPYPMAKPGEAEASIKPIPNATPGEAEKNLIPLNEPKKEEPAAQMTMPSPHRPPSPIMKHTEEQVGAGQSELDRLIKTGSGISQIKNPFVKTLARIGDVAGSSLFPAATMMIPGTELHHGLLVKGAEERLNSALGQEKSEASTEESRARTNLIENPELAMGKGPEDKAFNSLMSTVNPDTGKPYTADEAYAHLQKDKLEGKEPKEGELPLGDKIDQLNKTLQDRYAVLNPGKTIPTEYQLQKGANQKDYDRVDKALEAEERAKGTKAQQDETNELRRQTQALIADREADRKAADAEKKDKDDRKVVVGADEGGNQVLVSAGEAKKLGLNNIMDAPAADVSKAFAARQFLPLVDNPNAKDIAHQGIKQIIDELDKRGELGIVASRWNEMLTGKIGHDQDPDGLIERLRVKIGLSQTLLLNLHVGNRGGAYMLEHFEDLANAKKLDAATLRAGIDSEEDYAKHRAMLPQSEPEGRSISKAALERVAKEHNISYEDAKKDAEAHKVKVIE